MTNRLFVSIWTLMAAIAVPALGQDRPPNIVMILGDDLGYADVGFNGRKEWATPNIDRLAREGTIFQRFYTSSVVCAPSRAALMTGRCGIHNGVTGNGSYDLPAGEVTVAEVLKKRGYATALFGKWHAGPARPGNKTNTHPMDQGFDEFFGFTNARHAWQKFPAELFDGREKKPSKGYADTLFADRAVDFIGRKKADPFFLYLALTAPHSTVEAPNDDVLEFVGKFKESDHERLWNASYAAMVTRMDKEVGRVTQALADAGVADNTLLVFSSDHGATFEVLERGAAVYHDSNRPFRGQKRTLWEGGARVPTFARWPGKVPASKESREVLAMIDLMPTFCAAAGADVPSDVKLDGTNMLDVFIGKSTAPDRTLFWEWREGGNTQLAAMRGNMKLVINGGNKPELYDVEADPAERINRSADHADLTRQLDAELEAWMTTESDVAKALRTKDVKEEEGRSSLSLRHDMKYITLLLLFVASTSTFARAADGGAPPRKRNVLFITADDYNVSMGAYGNKVVQTPNLDRLAAQGVRFDRAYCQNPLCNPSRASFMSGLRPNTTGVQTNGPRLRNRLPDVVTLPQLFHDNGYVAARVGKIYHQGIPGGVGKQTHDDEKSWDIAINPPGAEFATPGPETNPTPERAQGFRFVMGESDGQEQHDHQAATEAIKILESHTNKPLFLAVGFIRPHVPPIAPKKHFDRIPLEKIVLPDVPAGDWDDVPPAAFHAKEPYFGMNEQQSRELVRAYYASVSFMDEQVGRLLDALDRLKLADDTLIVFLGDHGYALGEHRTFQKMLLFEESARVPLLMAGAGVTGKGVAPRGLVELIDVYPTVAELCGLKSPAAVEGMSLKKLLDDPAAPGKAAAFTQLQRKEFDGRSVRTERWRYTEWNRGADGVELYDHQSDPREHTNLAKVPKHSDTIAGLKRLLDETLPATRPSTLTSPTPQ